MKVSITEQEMFGKRHWRVMPERGKYIFGMLQVDFDSVADAVACVRGEARRKQVTTGEITVTAIGSVQPIVLSL